MKVKLKNQIYDVDYMAYSYSYLKDSSWIGLIVVFPEREYKDQIDCHKIYIKDIENRLLDLKTLFCLESLLLYDYKVITLKNNDNNFIYGNIENDESTYAMYDDFDQEIQSLYYENILSKIKNYA